MKLKRLYLQGFKSFKDRTTIYFDNGITGIVGPNGCGKSNIVDALFWVMGEQSAKHLRGNNMKDLIFSGSSKFSPASFAEVTLVLENPTKKHIHIGGSVHSPEEIQLTRKLYRNGETEYRINNIPARLKDIQEVFMDTGAGAKSYSIIAQGEIDRLVKAKPEERRMMIEEVAGITKFKVRKKESLKKIDQTNQNLVRLNDLQSEIYKNLKKLENQAEKAHKAKSLKEKIRRHELIVESHREYDYLTQLEESQKKLFVNKDLLAEFTLNKDKLELSLVEEREKKEILTTQIEEKQEVYSEHSQTLAKDEERLRSIKDKIFDREKLVKDKTAEKEELLKDIENRKEKNDQINQQLEELMSLNESGHDTTDLEEEVEILSEKVSDLKEELSENESKAKNVRAEYDKNSMELFKIQSKLEDYQNNLVTLNEEIEILERKNSDQSKELKQLIEDEAQKKLEQNNLKQKKIEVENQLNEAVFKEKDLSKKEKDLFSKLTQKESKVLGLKEVNIELNALAEGAKKLVEDNSEAFDLFNKQLETHPDYTKAVELAFENYLFHAIAIQDMDPDTFSGNFDQAISMEALLGKAKKLNFTEDTLERIKLAGFSELIPFSEQVSFKSDYLKNKFKDVLEGFFFVEDLDLEKISKISEQINFKAIVDLKGELCVFNSDLGLKVVYRNSNEQKIGVIERDQLILSLEDELGSERSEYENIKQSLEQITEKKIELEKELSLVSKEYNQVHESYLTISSKLSAMKDFDDNHQEQLSIYTQRKSDISQKKLELIEAEEKLNDSIENFDQEKESLESAVEETKEILVIEQERLDEKKEQLQQIVSFAKTFESQKKSFDFQLKDNQEQIERYQEKIVVNENLVEESTVEIETLENESVEKKEAIEELVQLLKDLKEELSLQKDNLAELLSEMNDREKKAKDLSVQIVRLEKENVELSLKSEKIIEDEELHVRDLYERFQVNMRLIIADYLEFSAEQIESLKEMDFVDQENNILETYHFEKRYPAQIKESAEKFKRYKKELSRLGEINWHAVDEYERLKLRHEFLKQQETELKESLQNITDAIAHIDEKCRIRFEEAYHEVNSRFTKVFPIIFGGGSAHLQVVGSLKEDTCGIEIVAQPPGKKMQSVNLMSGGEKAMTAVSLIFSIFLVKPSPFCLLDEVDAPLDDANVGRFNELLREMSSESQFILITHNKKTMELNDSLYGVTMQEPGVSSAVSIQVQ